MKNYSDLLGINTLIPITIELEPVGNPEVQLTINNNQLDYTVLNNKITVTDFVQLLSSITIEVELINKHYTLEYETAVIIQRLSIDNINLIPDYDYLATYINDHNNSNPTHYLGFNGKWTLTIDRPFYQWLHQAQEQGWLLS
jgi:hypothetical protein